MISIPRPILRAFRSLIRRAGLHKRQGAEPCFSQIAGPEECHIRAASAEVAIEYRHTGQFDVETILLPTTALDAWDGRGNELVALEKRSEHQVLSSWSDRGVPRQAEYRVGPKDRVTFPDPPSSLTPNEPGLWGALRSAAVSTDHYSSRYALGCLHLQGALGRIDATDGRQILSQSGYEFGWSEDVLVPAMPILGCRELELGEPVGFARCRERRAQRRQPDSDRVAPANQI